MTVAGYAGSDVLVRGDIPAGCDGDDDQAAGCRPGLLRQAARRNAVMAARESGKPIYGLIRGFLNHRVAPNLVAIIMVIAGLVALTRLNTQFFPTTEIPTITVSIAWPGASAQEIAEGILDVVEPEVRFIDGIDKVQSYAVEGLVADHARVQRRRRHAEGTLRRREPDATITTLPQESERPSSRACNSMRRSATSRVGTVRRGRCAGGGQATARPVARRRHRPRTVFPASETVRSGLKFRTRPCVSSTCRLATSPTASPSISQNTPLGNLEGGNEKQLRARGRITTADGVAGIELKAFENGQKVLVRDVAVVREAYEEGGPGLQGWGEERSSSTCSVQSPATSLDEYDAVHGSRFTQSSADPGGSDFRRSLEDRRPADQNADGECAVGFVLVVLVLLVFLNLRVAFWVAVGVPISLLATFAFMLQADRP